MENNDISKLKFSLGNANTFTSENKEGPCKGNHVFLKTENAFDTYYDDEYNLIYQVFSGIKKTCARCGYIEDTRSPDFVVARLKYIERSKCRLSLVKSRIFILERQDSNCQELQLLRNLLPELEEDAKKIEGMFVHNRNKNDK